MLNEGKNIDEHSYLFKTKQIEELIEEVYKTFKQDKETYRFITSDEMLTSLKYFSKRNL